MLHVANSHLVKYWLLVIYLDFVDGMCHYKRPIRGFSGFHLFYITHFSTYVNYRGISFILPSEEKGFPCKPYNVQIREATEIIWNLIMNIPK